MEYVKIILEWLCRAPRWCKVVAPLLAAACAVVYLLSSCANTKAIVRSTSDYTNSTITISTSNPVSVEMSNSLDSTKFNINPKKSK